MDDHQTTLLAAQETGHDESYIYKGPRSSWTTSPDADRFGSRVGLPTVTSKRQGLNYARPIASSSKAAPLSVT